GGSDERWLVRVHDVEYGRQVSPLIVLADMGIGPVHGGCNRVAPRPQGGAEAEREDLDLSGGNVREHMPEVVGVSSEDRLAQTVLDHVSEHEFGNRGLRLHRDAKLERLSYVDDLYRLSTFVEQRDGGDRRLTGTGYCLDLSGIHSALVHCALVARRQKRVVVVHHRLGIAFQHEATRVQQDGPVADRLDGLLVVGYQ